MSLRIIEAPTVKVVGSMAVDHAAMADWLAANGVASWESDAPSDGERLVEFSARSCYWSFGRPRPGGNKAMIGHLLEAGHGSCLEHAVFTVAIAGVSRSLTHELIRHRHLSPSQLSQRYFDETDAAFVVPPLLLGGQDTDDVNLHYAYHSWRRSVEFARDCYMDAVYRLLAKLKADDPERSKATINIKRAREAARSVLPNCVETRIVLTGNARAWRGAIEQRGSIHADLEIRRLACTLLRELKATAPHIFDDMDVFTDTDGRESVRSEHKKV